MLKSKLFKTQWHYDNIILTLCIVVLITALTIGSFREVGTFGVESDFYEVYAIQAENILAGQPYTYQHNPPGYCLLLAAVTFLTGNTFIAAKIISAFAAALFGLITYLLLKALFEISIAFISTIFSLITIIPNSFLAATDIVGAALIMLPIWIFLRQSSLTFNACFISGILTGFAYLVRSNAIFICIGIIFSLVFILNQKTRQKRLIKIVIFAFGVMLIVFPWFIYNWKINKSLFNSSAYLQIAAHFYHPQDDEFITALMEMQAQFNSLLEVLLYNPLKIIARYLQDVLFLNISRLFVPKLFLNNLEFPNYQLVVAIPLLIISIGLFILLIEQMAHFDHKKILKRRMAFIIINLLGYLILGLVGFHRRYYFFIFPLIFTLIIYPLFCRNIHFFNKRTSLRWLLVIILGFVLSGAAYFETKSTIVSEPKYLIEIADFLKSYSSPQEVLITRKPHLAYLSKLKGAFPLANSADEYLVKAQEIKARYIAYSDYEASLWSGLKSLSNPLNLPKNFKLIYHHQATNTLIYEINYK